MIRWFLAVLQGMHDVRREDATMILQSGKDFRHFTEKQDVRVDVAAFIET
jgi:hypothetical protein